jgi:tetratricopeptide (TPR) repeat protein
MYISAPSGTKLLASYLIPEEEYSKLESADFNTYGEEKSLEVIQFMRDLDWVYISFDEGDRISLRPTEKGLRIFEDGLKEDLIKDQKPLIDLIRKYIIKKVAEEDCSQETQDLADYYMKSGNYTRAIDFGSNAIKLGLKSKDEKLLAKGHYLYGTINLYKLELGYAQSHLEKAILFSDRVDDIKTKAMSLVGLGSVYGYRYDNEKSLECFEKANLLFSEIDDKKGLNLVKMNEAYVYASMDKLEEFFHMNQEAIEFFVSIGDKHHLEFCYLNQSAVLLSMGKPNEAIDSVVEAHELAREMGNERMLHLSGLNIAKIYIDTKRFGDSYDYITGAYEFFRKNFDMNGVAQCHLVMSTYFIATKNRKAADEEIRKMEKNFSSKVFRPIIDGYVSVIRIMKLYDYPEKEILLKVEEFQKKCKQNNKEDLFKSILEESV